MGGSAGDDQERVPVRFCTMADSRFFPGVVALVNSLRLLGHTEPISVLDLGLTEPQRRALSTECDLVGTPPRPPRQPFFLKPFVARAAPADVVVPIDADIIVTRPLHDLIERARHGGVVVFPDALPHRWFAEWQDLFDLGGPLRRQHYVNTGCFMVCTSRFPTLLPRWAEACARVETLPTVADDMGAIDTPVGFGDQDAFNALVMSEFPTAVLDLQPPGTEAHRHELRAVEVRDVHTLDCRLDGTPVSMLHHWGGPKPWDTSTSDDFANAYTTCLLRLLDHRDLAIRIDRAEIPRWLRRGVAGVVARRHAAAPRMARRAG